jgi:hypothetical protein
VSFFANRWPEPDPEDDDDFDDDFDFEPQARYLGGVVPLELLIARSDAAAFGVRNLVAYPDGFELTLSAWVRKPARGRRGRFHQSIILNPMDHDGDDLPPELLRFGIEFPDGASVTNLDEPSWSLSPDATEPAHGLESHSGGGSDDHYEQQWWAWPLPTAGTLAFVGEWPAYDIAETRVEIDAALIIDAAARAMPVWPDLAGSTTHMTHAMFRGRAGAVSIRRDDTDESAPDD